MNINLLLSLVVTLYTLHPLSSQVVLPESAEGVVRIEAPAFHCVGVSSLYGTTVGAPVAVRVTNELGKDMQALSARKVASLVGRLNAPSRNQSDGLGDIRHINNQVSTVTVSARLRQHQPCTGLVYRTSPASIVNFLDTSASLRLYFARTGVQNGRAVYPTYAT